MRLLGRVARRMRAIPLRVIPELRPYHLKLLEQWPEANTYYLWGKYDLTNDQAISIRRITPTKLLYILLATKAPFVEIWEPLWMRLLPLQVAAFCSFFIGGLLRGRMRRFRTYCLENNNSSALFGPRMSNPLLTVALRHTIGIYIYAAFERLAFASPSARDTYRSFPLVPRIASTVILNLPAKPGAVNRLERRPVACFVGQLEERKGIKLLTEAWPLVEQRRPDVSLLIIGDGELRDVVERFVCLRSTSRRWAGFLSQGSIANELNDSRILIAPSVRYGRWREQIGLPIHDALVAGLTVVTTNETGLAPWLRKCGHFATHDEPSAASLAESICLALDARLSPGSVTDDLPLRDGRVVAAEYLYGDVNNEPAD
ncbi:hypothetical protein Csp2054_13950 [Curtobacterium sp. 'Ferrero']|uniref:glycosyltransferase family 4 protein n=1 Tax=Curtobacterium sp. 'Ferrero' TaxID=2033654 RepID=UPI000BCD759F|nr:glycosyltransferase family 4 protein [Curtobacterium sp. 'Ferrero']PCN47083.1 hypothetical protein Csp2054_13950 [Curtobacterium sp. 'Ferrero']